MTKTEQLREEIESIRREALGDDCAGYLTDTILTACKKAGLAFVVKDAELPKNIYLGDLSFIYASAQQDMLKAGFKMWKEIELT